MVSVDPEGVGKMPPDIPPPPPNPPAATLPPLINGLAPAPPPAPHALIVTDVAYVGIGVDVLDCVSTRTLPIRTPSTSCGADTSVERPTPVIVIVPSCGVVVPAGTSMWRFCGALP